MTVNKVLTTRPLSVPMIMTVVHLTCTVASLCKDQKRLRQCANVEIEAELLRQSRQMQKG